MKESQTQVVEAEPHPTMAEMDEFLDKLDGMIECSYCRLFHDPMDCQKKHSKWICKAWMYRHLGGVPEELQKLTDDETAEFFQKASQSEKVDGFARWKVTKAVLTDVVSKQQILEHKRSVGGSYKPTAVYEKEGYTKAQVEWYNDYQDHPEPVGRLWRVPLMSVSFSDTKQSVENKLMEREEACRRRRVKQRGKMTRDQKKQLEDLRQAEEVWNVPSSDDEAGDKKRKREAGMTEKQRQREEKAAQAKLEKEKAKRRKKEELLASRAMPQTFWRRSSRS